MRLILYIVLFFVSSTIYSQKIDTENFNYKLVNRLLLEKVNQERTKKKAQELTVNKNLYKASKHHSDWQAKKNKMTHYQTTITTKSPRKRVDKTGATFKMVGENVAFTDINTTVKVKMGTRIRTLDVYTYQDLAHILFEGWKHSKDHYKNMIHKSYNTSGLSISLSKDKKRLYATQVFGMK